MRTVWLISLTVMLSFSCTAVCAGGIKCSYCGKEAAGTVYKAEYDGSTIFICAECLASSPKCSLCGIPVRKPDGWDGRDNVFCTSCYRNRKVCTVCDRTLVGDGFVDPETRKMYCRDCYENAEQCSSCHRPMKAGSWTVVRDSNICADCIARLPVCSRCGHSIVDGGMSYMFAEGIFCRDCHEHPYHCYVCGIPLGDEYLEFKGDRLMCPGCSPTAIITRGPMRMIRTVLRNFLEEGLGMEIMHYCDLDLARTRKELGGTQGEAEGKELGLFKAENDQFTIYILQGVTEEMCYEAMAHELAHAWHAERGMQHADQETKEGFAQWVASKTLEHFGYERALKRLKLRTDYPYGTGYRKYLTIENEGGREAVFRYLYANSQGER